MDYIEAESFMKDDKGKIELGLDRVEELLSLLDHPEQKLKFVHVAGTNGKGSVCAMTAEILKTAGYKTGLFTSPVIMDFRDQFKIDGASIDKDSFIEVTGLIKEASDQMNNKPSSFEKAVALALVYFLKEGCAIAILEVGMGGLGDATNVIPAPLVSCITQIDYDHMKFLGNTLTEIAANKAGIIKKDSRVVVSDQSQEVMELVKHRTMELGCAFRQSQNSQIRIIRREKDCQHISYKGVEYKLSLLGDYQAKNLATVIEIIESLRDAGLTIEQTSLMAALKQVKWEGRFERISEQPLFLIDGAHNPNGIEALLGNLTSYFPDKKFVFLVGILADKDYKSMLLRMLPLASSFITIAPDNPRAMSSEQCAIEIRACGFKGELISAESTRAGVELALKKADQLRADPAIAGICEFGSLYNIKAVKTALNDIQKGL